MCLYVRTNVTASHSIFPAIAHCARSRLAQNTLVRFVRSSRKLQQQQFKQYDKLPVHGISTRARNVSLSNNIINIQRNSNSVNVARRLCRTRQ